MRCNCWPRSSQASTGFRFECRGRRKKYKQSYCCTENTLRYPGSWSSQCCSRCSPKNSLGSHLRHMSHNWATLIRTKNMSSDRTQRDLYSWCKLMRYKSNSFSKHPSTRSTECHWADRVPSKYCTHTRCSWNNLPRYHHKASTENYTTSMDESSLNINSRHKNHSSARYPHTSSNLFHCCSASC